MKEPILSREEVQEIQRKGDITFFVPDDSETWPGTYINLQQLRDYTARIESALLEKLCGEPVAWRAQNLSGSGGAWAYRDADDRFEDQHGQPVGEPLYAINRSEA